MPQTLSDVAENWYARLNRLKDRFHDSDLTDEQKDKCKRLIGIMVGRMMKVSTQYIEAKTKASVKTFAHGGIIKGSEHASPKA
jgi:hypothetical protein